MNSVPNYARFEEENRTFFTLEGSVFYATYPIVVLFTVYTLIVVIAYKGLGSPDWMTVPTYYVAILTGLVGTLLAFRVNQSYDRYWEGRKQWSSFHANIRNMARLIWLNWPDQTPLQKAQKVAAFKLLMGYPYSVKHALRGEHRLDYEDYTGLLPGVETVKPFVEKTFKVRYRVSNSRNDPCFCFRPAMSTNVL
jgi:predicted membrane chloride channel (bestrophin family)